MRHRYALAVVFLGACARHEAPARQARQPNADSATAVTAERAVDPPPPSQTADRKQLVHAMHDLSITLSNATTNARDTADAPRWNAKLDAIANELPDNAPTQPDAATAYQQTQYALQLGHQMRIREAYAHIDTAFRAIPDR